MYSKRQNQVSNFLRKELGELFLINAGEWAPKKMLTITVVRITKDLSIANIYVSVFPSGDCSKNIDLLNKNVAKIRFELGKRIKNQLKKIPELNFHLDDSLDYIDKIDRALKK